MRRVEAEVQIERLLLRQSLIDELQTEGGPEIGRVPAFRQTRVVIRKLRAVQEQFGLGRVGIIESPRRRIQAAVKAPAPRRDTEILPDVPLPAQLGEHAKACCYCFRLADFFTAGRTPLYSAVHVTRFDKGMARCEIGG